MMFEMEFGSLISHVEVGRIWLYSAMLRFCEVFHDSLIVDD